MAAQPQPPNTRQSGPEAKPSPPKDALHKLKPGGPIMPKKQGFVNPGPTDNLRGVEPNTAMHRGTPNPEQKGSDVRHGDHNPGMNDDTHGHGIDVKPGNMAVQKHHGQKLAPPPPDPRGTRK